VIFGLSFGDETFFPTSMVVLNNHNFLAMGLQILLRQIDFGYFVIVSARRIILAVFVGLCVRIEKTTAHPIQASSHPH
jgi:hypothetical protein